MSPRAPSHDVMSLRGIDDESSVCSFSSSYSRASCFKGSKGSSRDHLRVCFSPSHDKVVATKHISDMDEEERSSIWYGKDDLALIKETLKATLDLMKEDRTLKSADPEEHCSRGLEVRLSEHSKRRNRRRADGLRAVLDEQDRQRDAGHGNWDADAIASRYVGEAVRKAQSDAFRVGRLDARQVLLSK